MGALIVSREIGLRQPKSHQVYGTFQIWDKSEFRATVTWRVTNTGNANAWLGSTVTLVHVKGFFGNDEDVVEYESNAGIFTDEFSRDGSKPTVVQGGPYSVPPGTSDWPFIVLVPGSKGSFPARQWWTANDNANFNLRLGLYELPIQTARPSQEGRQIGEHEYKAFANVQYNIGIP